MNHFALTDPTEHAGVLFVSWYQFAVSWRVIVFITRFPHVPFLNLFPRLSYDLKSLLHVLPVSIIYVLMIGLNNLCLEHVTVGEYHIVRALTVPILIVILSFVPGKRASCAVIFACAGIVTGYSIGIEGEVDLSLHDAIYGLLSSTCVAAYSIVVKEVIMIFDDNEFLLIEYNTPIALLVLTPFVWLSGEFHVFLEKVPIEFWVCQTAAGLLGFVLNIAIFLNIKYTTPLTHNVVATVKSCLQMTVAFFSNDRNEIHWDSPGMHGFELRK
jgi:GDP-fucose transporter C1